MEEEELKLIEERLNAATKGPWEASPKCGVCVGAASLRNGDYLTIAYLHSDYVDTEGDKDSDYDGESEGARNTEFIGHAPTDMAALIAEVKRLKEKLGEA